MTLEPATSINLSVELGRLRLPNPVLVASGTFGYAREMEGLVDVSRLGGILPKTITQEPRAGNAPWRTIETAAGMLNSIGLDNDGIEAFVAHHLPYLAGLGVENPELRVEVEALLRAVKAVMSLRRCKAKASAWSKTTSS